MLDTSVKATLDEWTLCALNNREAAYNSYALAERCITTQIPGDFVECGCYSGVQCAAMALALKVHGATRKVHLFDSFCGIPQAGPKDEVSLDGMETTQGLLGKGDGTLRTTGVSACPIATAQANIVRWGFTDYPFLWYEGWFEETVPKAAAAIEQIAILRLDGDLYSSTKVCLDHLAPKVARGGYIIIDDGFSGCQRAVREYWERTGITPAYEKVDGVEWPRYWRVA